VSSQTLIVFKFNSLFNILEEISLELNFKIINVESEKLLNKEIENLNNYLIISNQKNLIMNNQIILSDLPMRISKLLEKVNIEFLKLHFNNQSRVKIKNYIIDLNSRQMLLNDMQLKLTEKEINTITYLSRINKPVSIDELQENVWSYQSDVETHTVETHIYRLRKKIFNSFNDNKFIISKKNGYQIS
tara:strand:- start:1205 stop:1768 length:564 start_codon:yes stop_codon:yes gene_type:complete